MKNDFSPFLNSIFLIGICSINYKRDSGKPIKASYPLKSSVSSLHRHQYREPFNSL